MEGSAWWVAKKTKVASLGGVSRETLCISCLVLTIILDHYINLGIHHPATPIGWGDTFVDTAQLAPLHHRPVHPDIVTFPPFRISSTSMSTSKAQASQDASSATKTAGPSTTSSSSKIFDGQRILLAEDHFTKSRMDILAQDIQASLYPLPACMSSLIESRV